MSLSSSYALVFQGTDPPPDPYSSGVTGFSNDAANFEDGRAAGEVDLVAYFRATIAAGGTFSYDLRAPLSEFNDIREIDEIVAFDLTSCVQAAPGSIVVKPGASNPFVEWIAAGSEMPVPCGGAVGFRALTGTGKYPVTVANRTLGIENTSGVDVTVQIYLLGRTTP